MPMHPNTRLIVALDVTDRDWALDIVDAVAGNVDAIKINWPLVLHCGPDIVEEMSSVRPVICDFKIADIPNTARLIAESAFERGATGVIAHAFSGADTLEAVVDIAREFDGLVFSVVELSHPGAVESFEGVLERNIDISLRAKVDGFIAPGTRPAKITHIRERAGAEAIILAPGIGAQGGSARNAIGAGADFVIAGRAIYTAEDPEAVAREIIDSLQ